MELFGVIGMICVQSSTLFQIIKFVNKKTTKGVSIGFWWVILLGLISYLVYSIHIKDWLYITSNSAGITLSIISISLYYFYFWKENGLPDAEDVEIEEEVATQKAYSTRDYLDNLPNPNCSCED